MHPRIIARTSVLAALLGCVDSLGLKILLVNARVVSRLCWERFHGGDWGSICEYPLLDPRRPDLGSQAESDAPRTLTIRMAQFLHTRDEYGLLAAKEDSTDRANLILFKKETEKYWRKGQLRQR